MHAVTFGSAAEYMAYPKPDVPACLVLDVELPDINGLDLQSQIAQGNHPQIVFITGHGDIPTSVRAIKAGAVDFLTKPFKEADLMRAIHAAIAQDRDARRKRAELAELRQRLSSLTPREREVLPLVVSGLLNKQAAAELGISEITIQIHRGKIMQKMGAGSLAELVRMAGTLEIPMTHSRHPPMIETADCARGSSSGGRRIIGAQGKLKYRATGSVRGKPQPAIVSLDDRAANRQAHPHTVGFGREKRVEYPIDVLRADSCPGVRNRYHYAVAFVRLGFHA